MKKILITGVLGQVGFELKRTLAPFGRVIGIDKEDLDLSNPSAIRSFIKDCKPDLIVNPAAYTAVDHAENDPETCFLINRDAAAIIAEEAKKNNALLIHYSTDYVFDGSSERSYIESDKPNPLSVYGASKLAGDEAVSSLSEKHLILRTSWVYGSRGRNFLLTMLKLGREKEKLSIVQDQIGAPTWSRMIAEATALMTAKLLKNEVDPHLYGIYNLTSAGKTNWLEFAETIFSIESEKNSHFKKPELSPLLTKDYKTAAKRPLNSLLSHDKLNENFDLFMPNWKECLRMCMEDMQK